jgi:DNA-directed RNA polymerase specialized sigma24 family protein
VDIAGLDVKETAEVLGVSPETVLRDWRLARAWLLGELSRWKGEKTNQCALKRTSSDG